MKSSENPSKIYVSQVHSNQMQKDFTQIHQQQFWSNVIPQQRIDVNVPFQMSPHFNQQRFQGGKNIQNIQQHQLISHPQPQPVPHISSTIYEQYNNKEEDLSKICFNDDEMIKQKQEQSTQAVFGYDLNENIQFEIKSLYHDVKLLNTQSQYLPGNISIKSKELTTNQNDINRRVGVDLICLIDISGSMMGTKIEMVKNSLTILLQFLGDNDRLQLITFNYYANRLTPLKCVTKQNKIYFNQIISKIQANGQNQISEATKMAFCQLKRRKYRNNVTSIFLLSDGVDFTFPEIKEQIKTVNEVFTIHTFGFGEDHDANVMTSICNLKSGSFYFVQNITLLDEFFADALGGLISVVCKELDIIISSQAPAPYQGIQISKTYGNMWQKKGNSYNISQPLLTSGSRKDYVFELLLPKFEGRVQDYQRNLVALSAELKMKDPISGSIINKKANLVLTLFGTDEQITQNINPDIDVYAQYFRVKGTEIIDQARKACESNQNENALKLINNMLIQIQNHKTVAAQCQGIIQDLQQAKQASGRQSYQLFGGKQMCQMVSNNYQQAGVNSLFSASGVQLQQPAAASYQNIVQEQMMFQVQKQKASQQNY